MRANVFTHSSEESEGEGEAPLTLSLRLVEEEPAGPARPAGFGSFGLLEAQPSKAKAPLDDLYGLLEARDYARLSLLPRATASYLLGLWAAGALAPLSFGLAQAPAAPAPPCIAFNLLHSLVCCAWLPPARPGGRPRLLLRPRRGLREFLRGLAERARLVVFSRARRGEVAAIVRRIDPQRKLFAAVLSRADCALEGKGRPRYVKGLARLGADSQTVFVGQAPADWAGSAAGFVPLLPFRAQGPDDELARLSAYLHRLLHAARDRPLQAANLELLALDRFLAPAALLPFRPAG